jgi:hypothetical protein
MMVISPIIGNIHQPAFNMMAAYHTFVIHLGYIKKNIKNVKCKKGDVIEPTSLNKMIFFINKKEEKSENK